MRSDRPDDVLFASCGSYEQASVYRISRANADPQIEVVLDERGMGRTSLAIAPSNNDYVYALAASNDDGPNGAVPPRPARCLPIHSRRHAQAPGKRGSPTAIPCD